jgi:hypothetical protein
MGGGAGEKGGWATIVMLANRGWVMCEYVLTYTVNSCYILQLLYMVNIYVIIINYGNYDFRN